MSQKIGATHLSRAAVVYLRQSSLRQLRENRESTARQYALEGRARALGWSAERIQIVDEDLGISGSSTAGRSGFQRLAEDVAQGRIGAIFALEVSRLARSSADWYRLLELCRLADVVIVDEQTVFSPTDCNDRLLLGLKGQMSEAELYWMRLRLQGGKLNKARRGELAFNPAIGYRWDAGAGRLEMEADREVREAIGLMFERFRLEGTAYGVMRYFNSNNLRFPTRAVGSDDVRWIPASYGAIGRLLHNPVYAGAYVFGRQHHRQALVDGEVRHRCISVPIEEWSVCLKEQHAGYITWEEFMENQRRLADNRSRPGAQAHSGAPREGRALLQGLVLCGKCGGGMTTSHQEKGRRLLYVCRRPLMNRGEGHSCWMVTARPIDDAVVDLALEAVCPDEVELGLAVLQEADKQAGKLRQQWRLRLEAAEYEARLAERRYKAVDPDNRIVASTLESTWEEKLRTLHDLRKEYEETSRRSKLELGPEDRQRILQLSRDLPRVFRADTTTPQQRKTLLRVLIRQVTLSPVEVPERSTRIQVLWQTGAVTELTVNRPSSKDTRSLSASAAARLREMFPQTKTDRELARLLNREGYVTGTKKPWTKRTVRDVRKKFGLRRGEDWPGCVRRPNRRDDGLFSIHGVAEQLGVSERMAIQWHRDGVLRAVEGGQGLGDALWFRLDEAELGRIEEHRSSKNRRRLRQLSEARAAKLESRKPGPRGR